jgi:hypothetical protein
MNDPKKTGISEITGSAVFIRHASEIERDEVALELAGRGVDMENAIVLVAVREGDRSLLEAFAVLSPSGERDVWCLILSEGDGGRGMGKIIIQHLLEHLPVAGLVVDRKSSRYLSAFGFRRREENAPAVGTSVGCPHLVMREASLFVRPRWTTNVRREARG